MRKIDLPVPIDPESTEQAFTSAGLAISLRTTLKSYPGSIHWHVKKPGSKGTLEITFLTDKGTAWISVHANREAEWIDDAVSALA